MRLVRAWLVVQASKLVDKAAVDRIAAAKLRVTLPAWCMCVAFGSEWCWLNRSSAGDGVKKRRLKLYVFVMACSVDGSF